MLRTTHSESQWKFQIADVCRCARTLLTLCTWPSQKRINTIWRTIGTFVRTLDAPGSSIALPEPSPEPRPRGLRGLPGLARRARAEARVGARAAAGAPPGAQLHTRCGEIGGSV